MPIWQLLGGAFRDSIRIYNDCHAGDDVEDPASWAATAKAVEAHGFDAIDIDPRPTQRDSYNRCISNRDVAFHIEVVTAIREAVNPDTDLAIDAHWYYAPADILKVAYAFESLNLLWLEDPIPPENIAAMHEFKAAPRTPICTGENFYTRHGFRELVQTQAADIISPDLAKAGGLMEGRRIADLADNTTGAAQHLWSHRHGDLLPHLRRFTEFPRSRVPSPRQRAVEHPHRGARPHSRRSHRPAAIPRSRRHRR